MLIEPFSQHEREQQVSAYNRSFVFNIQSYNSKQVPVGLLCAEKMPEVVLLNVFRIGFPASLIGQFHTKNLKILHTGYHSTS